MLLNKKGFTLTELLVALAIIIILFIIVLIPLDPVQRFIDARNNQREADVNALHGAFKRYESRHGEFPECAGERAEIDVIECEDELVPGYFGMLPRDPQVEDEVYTGYLVKVDEDNIGVKAEHAERREIIAGDWED